MDRPRDKVRAATRDPVRRKERSKSAHTFHDSPFYEKFLFFENVKTGVSKSRSSVNVGRGCTSADESFRNRQLPVSSSSQNERRKLSASSSGCQSGSIHQSDLSHAASSTINRASNIYLSYGRARDPSLQVTPESAYQRYSRRYQGQSTSTQIRSSSTQGRSPITQESSPSIYFLNSNRRWSSNADRINSIGPSRVFPTDTSEQRSVINYSQGLRSSTHKTSERNNCSSHTVADHEMCFSPKSGNPHRKVTLGSTPTFPINLPTKGPPGGYIDAAGMKMSSDTLEIQTSPKSTLECQSNLPYGTSLGGTMPTFDPVASAVSEVSYVSKSSSNTQAVSDKSLNSSSEHVVHSDIHKDSVETSVNNISTAKIILNHSFLTNQNASRSITVIETQKCIPHTAPDTCTRFNDWLSSVMQLQREHANKEHWPFPEDDPLGAVSTQASLRPSKSPSRESTFTSAPGPETSPDKEDTVGDILTVKHCSSKATNTDLSFASEKVQLDALIECCLDASSDSAFSGTNFTKIENQQETAENRLSPKRCLFCHTAITGSALPGHQENEFFNDIAYQSAMLQHQQFLRDGIANSQRFNDPTEHLHSTGKTLFGKHDGHIHTNNAIESRRFSDSDFCGSDIKIQITGEDHYKDSTSTYPKQQDITEIPVSGFSQQRFRSTSDSTTRTFIPKGVSPHYMFPTSQPAWEEDDVSRYLVSPRNSVGSISSLLSYKSSNADSAVDLGPPDDDHDFEFADFLAHHQARRFSQSNDNLLSFEKSSAEDALADYRLETQSFANRSFGCHHSTLIPPGRRRSSFGIPEMIECYQVEKAHLEMSNRQTDPYSMPLKAGGNYYNIPTNRANSALGKINRRLSQTESAGILNLKEVSTSTKEVSPLHKTKALSYIISDDDIHAKSYHGTNASWGEVSATSSLEPLGGIDHLKRAPPTPTRSTFHDLPRYHVIPELIISDHSDNNGSSREGSPKSRPEEQDVDLDSPLPSRPGSSMSYSEPEQLDVEETGFLRSSSMSSLCSIASTCSTCTDMSDSESPPTGHKQSSWKKIRSFILWSPFIQVFKKHRYPWIQLAGHQGNFHAGEAGSVLKKLDLREQASFHKLMADSLKSFVPEYRGDVEKNGETYIQLQDLLCSFSHPSVMDVKMGVRTYLEDELQKARRSPTVRKDMYQKMIEIDCSAPTTEEHEQKAVTKPRYMQWRDEMSSSVELGFRVEGIKKSDGNSSKDFKKTKTRDSVVDIMRSFMGGNEAILTKYITRLKEMMKTQETSEFFLSHEVIGGSLLFVHDADENVGVWMIDFGKSEPLPKGVKIDHRSKWLEGNHEDGYLFGLDNLVSVLEEVQRSITSSPV